MWALLWGGDLSGTYGGLALLDEAFGEWTHVAEDRIEDGFCPATPHVGNTQY